MLVLSRNVGETIQIGENIEIQILGINRGQIRIGISAPREIQIVRSELLLRPRRCNPARPPLDAGLDTDTGDEQLH